jgi:hypothetical protein
MNRAFQKMNTVFSALRTEGVHGFAETNTGFFFSWALRNARGILAEVGLVVLFSAPYTLR